MKEMLVPEITVYTTPFCPYCARALGLFKKKGSKVQEIPAGFDAGKKREMIERAGGKRTFPQIFIEDSHIGGCDDLFALEQAGKLDPLLAPASGGTG